MTTSFLHLAPPWPSRPISTISGQHHAKPQRVRLHPPPMALPPQTTNTTTTTITSSSRDEASRSENAVLKLAWYSSELLGIAASLFRRPTPAEGKEEEVLESGLVGRDWIVEAIRDDFQRSYFVTGDLTTSAYEENCEFADPAGSFKGLRRFKRNCTNFGSLLLKSNMKLSKWEDFEEKGIGHWRFSCVMIFPWRPILSATGYTEYYFSPESGKIYRHVENWNVPKMALLKQILRPSRWVWDKKANT